jgi:hypothetical protein
MISVATPSRGRPDLTRQFVESAYENASDPNNIEMIFRFDNCDPALDELREMIDSLGYPNITSIVGDRMWGYSSLHEMMNEMCRVMRGDSIGVMIGGNDMRFVSKDWDKEYERVAKDNPISVIHVMRNADNGNGIQFPFITRKFYQILGHYALHPSLDGYLTFVALMSRCLVYSNVDVEHDYKCDDDVYTDRVDSDKEKQHTFWAEETQIVIRESAKKINHVLGMIELSDFHGWDK